MAQPAQIVLSVEELEAVREEAREEGRRGRVAASDVLLIRKEYEAKISALEAEVQSAIASRSGSAGEQQVKLAEAQSEASAQMEKRLALEAKCTGLEEEIVALEKKVQTLSRNEFSAEEVTAIRQENAERLEALEAERSQLLAEQVQLVKECEELRATELPARDAAQEILRVAYRLEQLLDSPLQRSSRPPSGSHQGTFHRVMAHRKAV